MPKLTSPALAKLFFFNPTDTAEVFSVFRNMKYSRNRDCDDLLIRPVKFVLDLILPRVAHLYNLILSSSVFPKSMQVLKFLPSIKAVIKMTRIIIAPYLFFLFF